MTAQGERLAWLDIAKGIGIVLVVTGHVLLGSDAAYAQPIANAIFAFHMPLFFLLAGLTLKRQAPREFALRKLVVFGLPYLGFLAALGVPTLMLSCGLGSPQPALGLDRCPVLAFKLLSGGSLLGGIFGAFWFVPCLFGGLVIAQLVLSQRSGLASITMVSCLTVIAYALPGVSPWSTGILSLGSAPMAAVLVLIGFALARSTWLDAKIVLVGCAILGFSALAVGAAIDFKFGEYGVPLFSMAGAVALSCLVMALSKQLAAIPVLARSLGYVGQSTLTVLYLHQSIHLGLRLAGLHSDLLLILLSLAIPLVLHNLGGQALSRLACRLRFNLSRKSPLLERPLK